MTCTRCGNSGFLNINHLSEKDSAYLDEVGHEEFLDWLEATGKNEEGGEYEDVTVCDCCGDGDYWYGVPGEHYNRDDPSGDNGPYAYNGGFCECH